MSRQKILITGVSGLIGSTVYQHLTHKPDHYDLYGFSQQRTREPYHSIATGAYGRDPKDFARVTAAEPAEPRNLYAASKIWAESLDRAEDFFETHKTRD